VISGGGGGVSSSITTHFYPLPLPLLPLLLLPIEVMAILRVSPLLHLTSLSSLTDCKPWIIEVRNEAESTKAMVLQ